MAFLAGSPPSALAQGTFGPDIVVRTSDGGPLISGMQSFFIPASETVQQIQIAIGFATDEVVSPETFFDSLTLTLQDDLANLTALYFTIDCTGTFWAPNTPGGLGIDPESIGRENIAFPDLEPNYSSKVAYFLSLPVPASMTGRQLTLYLDLFNNGDNVGSLGWMSHVVVVPEPGTAALAALGLVLAARWRARRR
jgi:PEP-CTERM motif.